MFLLTYKKKYGADPEIAVTARWSSSSTHNTSPVVDITKGALLPACSPLAVVQACGAHLNHRRVFYKSPALIWLCGPNHSAKLSVPIPAAIEITTLEPPSHLFLAVTPLMTCGLTLASTTTHRLFDGVLGIVDIVRHFRYSLRRKPLTYRHRFLPHAVGSWLTFC